MKRFRPSVAAKRGAAFGHSEQHVKDVRAVSQEYRAFHSELLDTSGCWFHGAAATLHADRVIWAPDGALELGWAFTRARSHRATHLHSLGFV